MNETMLNQKRKGDVRKDLGDDMNIPGLKEGLMNGLINQGKGNMVECKR